MTNKNIFFYLYDVIMLWHRKKIFFSRKGVISYTIGKLISHWFRIILEPWPENEVLERYFDLNFGMWRHVTDLKSKYLSRTSFSDHGSYMILNLHNTSFLTVYNMTTFGKKKILLLWRHEFEFDDVTEKRHDRRFWKYRKMLAHGP